MTIEDGLEVSSTPRTILVTGAAGLIGSEVVKLLLSQNVKVVACDNFSIGEWRLNDPLITWEQLDVSSPLLVDRLNSHDIDAVVHCAAHPGGKSLQEPVKDVEVNALGCMRLFDWCAKAGKPIVFTSSACVYGDQPHEPVQEIALLQPSTIYGVCKIACENFLKILGVGYGLDWVVLRIFSTYGVGHRPSTSQGVVNVMLTQLLVGNRLIVKGSLDRVRDLIYVKDVASAICKSIDVPEAYGQIINVGTGNHVTIRDLIHTLIKTLGRKLEHVEIVEEQATVGDPFYAVGDCSKARDILGFIPEYDLEKGLSDFVK